MSIKEYLAAEDECRYLCEGSTLQLSSDDLFVSMTSMCNFFHICISWVLLFILFCSQNLSYCIILHYIFFSIVYFYPLNQSLFNIVVCYMIKSIWTWLIFCYGNLARLNFGSYEQKIHLCNVKILKCYVLKTSELYLSPPFLFFSPLLEYHCVLIYFEKHLKLTFLLTKLIESSFNQLIW